VPDGEYAAVEIVQVEDVDGGVVEPRQEGAAGAEHAMRFCQTSGCWTRAASEGTARTPDRPVDLLSTNNVFDIHYRSV